MHLSRISIVAVAFAAATFIQCDGSEVGGEGPGDAVCEGGIPADVVYPDEEKASDEALVRVWEARCRASTDAARSYALVSPASGAVVPGGDPVELHWHEGGAHHASWLRFGVAKAYAHLPPVTGDVWLVELAPAGGGAGAPLYVFTGDTSWTPDDASWARLVAMGEVRATIWSAHLEKGVIMEASDGPFRGPTSSFRFEVP